MKAIPGLQAVLLSMAASAALAAVKIVAGVMGGSYALIADGIESLMDLVGAAIVASGLHWAAKPPDSNHPYGHGKAESLAALMVAGALILAAIGLAIQSVRQILQPEGLPAAWTLVVLVVVVVVKEWLFRRLQATGREIRSSSLESDAWHHRSDALTSLAAFLGISIAVLGGEGYAAADAWAALVACGIIFYNGVRLIKPALDEVMDAAVPEAMEVDLRKVAAEVSGVVRIEKCRVRKSGTGLMMDVHVVVDGELTVREGHEIGHGVKDRLLGARMGVVDVSVHVEPDGGR